MYILNYVFCISIKLCFNSISCSLYFLQLSVEDVPTIVGALDSGLDSGSTGLGSSPG